MANTIRVPRTHLIMALCLPVAVLIGYLLADPLDSSGLAIVTLVLAVLSTPLLIKYHHPLLIAAWNAAIGFLFLPGQPALWMVVAFVSLGVSVFHRATDPDKRFLQSSLLIKPMVCFALVVGVTAMLTGGIGFRSFGSSSYGGRSYLEIVSAFVGYFALTSLRIPAERAGLYVGVFFLSALTGFIGTLIYLAGPQFYFLYNLFPTGGGRDLALAEGALWQDLPRFGSFAPAALGLLCWLLARYGVRGTFDYSRPWRLLVLVFAVVGCLLSGFRSILGLFLLIFCFAFVLEGLWRTRALPILLLLTLAGLALVLPFSEKLPPSVQRCISFLPLKVQWQVAEEARYSTEWRLDMWRSLQPQIPKYLIKGKGYTFDASDLARAQTSSGRFGGSQEIFEVSMEYHNGPLSVLIPFGLPGMAAFLWFIIAGLYLLYRNYRYGAPALLTTNRLLLAAFISKTLFFFVIFGALHSELCWFTGMLGLSVSLNGGICRPATEPELVEEEAIEAV